MTRGVGGRSPSNIAQHLSGVSFPCRREDLLNTAKKNNAQREIMEALQALPEREYKTMTEVMEGFGGEKRGSKSGRKS